MKATAKATTDHEQEGLRNTRKYAPFSSGLPVRIRGYCCRIQAAPQEKVSFPYSLQSDFETRPVLGILGGQKFAIKANYGRRNLENAEFGSRKKLSDKKKYQPYNKY
ncbi:hypothetical protein OIU77_007130 [Salix suchowensis]|uniref:Uncharacterized protein n=1 Tax=Salix suchowensis TaxID=1278906 RepID=A0ABQ9AKR3_9ROSI|nr:hypothetical protein OIU77_007130 [Salix suchowensis]